MSIRHSATGAACQEAEEVLLLGGGGQDAQDADDATRLIRVQRHVARCANCQQMKAHLEATRADAHAAGAPPLDDVRRARILARLAPAIDELASQSAARRSPDHRADAGLRRPAWRAALVALACAGAAALVLTSVVGRQGNHRNRTINHQPAPAPTVAVDRPAEETRRPDVDTVAAPKVPPLPGASTVAAPPPALIAPYRVIAAGRNAVGGRRLVNQRFQHLQTAAGTTVRARVGERTRVSLVGPGDVSVLSAVDDVLDVGLDAGTLVADFVHRRTGRLRIHSPGAVTEVVGTLFAVEVRGQQSRVSVAQGRVVVQPSEGPPRVVSAGQSWTSGTASVQNLPAATAALLADHEAADRSSAAPPVPAAATVFAAPAAPAAATPAPPVLTPPTERPPVPTSTVVAIAQPRPSAALVPPGVSPPSPPPPPSAERIYRDAEAAMHRRDTAGAERALEQVVALGGGGPLADVARYELAQLAVRAGNQARAAQWLDALLASDREPALREPARFLRCEVQVRSGDAVNARHCLETFRARFPDSSRDAMALGWLVHLAPPSPQCLPLRSLVDEYLRRYPGGPDAALATRRKAACGP
ncbi:MAG: hypothetical protein QOI66_5420 [Myxococcales bacterium]|jgi:ferric-dicitrate binding protein FerR (iron transport regulator)|nr:hypothetical protein [Myxococcales bacterium]